MSQQMQMMMQLLQMLLIVPYVSSVPVNFIDKEMAHGIVTSKCHALFIPVLSQPIAKNGILNCRDVKILLRYQEHFLASTKLHICQQNKMFYEYKNIISFFL